MLSDWKFWVLAAVTVALMGLSAYNLRLQANNAAMQRELAARQQIINEATRLSQFNTRFIQALANLAAQTQDQNIQQLLADHGVTYTVNQPAPGEDAE